MTLGLGVRADRDPHLPPPHPSTSALPDPTLEESGKKCTHSGLASLSPALGSCSSQGYQCPSFVRHLLCPGTAPCSFRLSPCCPAAFSWAAAPLPEACRPQLSPEPGPSLPLLTALHGGGSCLPRLCPSVFIGWWSPFSLSHHEPH